MLVQRRGNYAETAASASAVGIFERLGDQAGMATSYSQPGNLETDRSGPVTTVIAWHVKALTIRLHLGVPQA